MKDLNLSSKVLQLFGSDVVKKEDEGIDSYFTRISDCDQISLMFQIELALCSQKKITEDDISQKMAEHLVLNGARSNDLNSESALEMMERITVAEHLGKAIDSMLEKAPEFERDSDFITLKRHVSNLRHDLVSFSKSEAGIVFQSFDEIVKSTGLKVKPIIASISKRL